MTQDNLSKLALAVAEDVQLIPGINTLKTIGGMLIEKIDDTSNLFREILIDCERSISDLDEREKKEFYEECYLIYQYTIQGKAKHNIELLIRYLKGQIESKELYIDDFYKYMDIFASLTVEEIKIISFLVDKKDFLIINSRSEEHQSDDYIAQNLNGLSESYSLQGKGLMIVVKDTKIGLGKEKWVSWKGIKTKMLDDMIKYLKLEPLEHL